MHFLNSDVNNPFMFSLETLPLPCVYLELPWIPTRPYCRLLANTFYPKKSTESFEQILCQLYSHVLSSIGLIQKNTNNCLEYLFVEKYNCSSFCIRQVLLDQFSLNHKSALFDCMVAQKKSYQQVFELSYKTVSASELFSLRLSKSQRQQGLYLMRSLSYHQHEHIYVYQKRHSLDNLPLDFNSLKSYWDARIQLIEPNITTLVIVLDFTEKPKFSSGGDDSVKPKFSRGGDDSVKPKFPSGGDDSVKPKFPSGGDDSVKPKFSSGGDDSLKPSNNENARKWTCEDTRKIIHMTLQLNYIFLSQHVPFSVVIFHRLPPNFSTFIQHCIEKSNTNITLGMTASSHKLGNENEIEDSLHQHRRALSLPLTLSYSHAINKICKSNQVIPCKETVDLSKFKRKQDKKRSEHFLSNQYSYKKSLPQRSELVNSMNSTIPTEWFTIKKKGTLREIKYEPTLRMSLQKYKSTRQSMFSVICHTFCAKTCGILNSSTIPLRQYSTSSKKPSTYSFLDDASSQSTNDDSHKPFSRSNTFSQQNMYSNLHNYSDQTLDENVDFPSESHLSLKSRRYEKASSPKVVRSRNKIQSQNNMHPSSSSSLISLISSETDFTITSLDLLQPRDGRI